jgi:hypothetical protein
VKLHSAPIKVLPFSPENLRSVPPAPTMRIETCPICSRIPGHVDRFVKGEELERDDIPPEVQQLRYYLRLGDHVTEISWAAAKQSEIHAYKDGEWATACSKSANGS